MPPRRQLSGISLKSLGRSIKNASSLSINRRDEEPLPTSNKLNISAPVPGTFQKLTPDIIPHDDAYGSTSLTSVPDAHDLGDQASASSQQPHALMTDDQVQLGNPAAHLPRAPRIPRWEERAQQRSRGQDVPRLGPFAPRSSSRTALSLSGAAPPVVPVEDAAREERTLARSHTSVAPVVGQAGPHDPVPRTPSLPGAWHAQHDRAMCNLDVWGYSPEIVVARLRRAFPELRAAFLSPAMVGTRLRQLDHDPACEYFRAGWEVVAGEGQRR